MKKNTYFLGFKFDKSSQDSKIEMLRSQDREISKTKDNKAIKMFLSISVFRSNSFLAHFCLFIFPYEGSSYNCFGLF